MKLSVIIPVYNEKNTIEALVKKVASANLGNVEKEIIIVDDFSTDGTRDILKNSNHKVVLHEKNQGKGAAIRTGLKEVTGEYVVIQDADLEYDPNDFKTMIEKMINENLKVLYGSRRLKKDNTQYAGVMYYVGGVFLSTLANILYRQKITDEPTCYKMFKTDFIRSLPLQSERFEFCPEVTALAGLRGVKIQEVPITYYPRHKKEGKKINWADGLHAVLVLIWYRLGIQKVVSLSKLNRFMGWVKENTFPIMLVLLATINLFLFSKLYGFHPNNDTESFLWTIERFRGIDAPFHPNRYLNPFYALVGASFFRFLSPANSLILTNIVFFYGIVLLTYGLIRRVFKDKLLGFLTALAVVPSYALIRYGLTQVQDIGGYFWFIATVYSGWRWFESRKSAWLYIGGLCVGLGMLTKESGAMGAFFVGILFLFSGEIWRKKISAFIKFSSIPFVFLLANQYHGKRIGYSSMEWLVWNWKTFIHDYTFFKWLGVNATTFNMIWVGAIIGVYYIVKNWKQIDRSIKIYFLAILPGSLSYFGWPIFISRTVFICTWFMVPLAIYGVYTLGKQGTWKKYVSIILFMSILIAPYALQSTLRYAHLFSIIDSCNKDFVCSWNYFWENRDTFSKQQ